MSYENVGSGYDPGAVGYELQGRAKAPPALDFLEAMQVLSLQPGDVLVFRTSHRLTHEQGKIITKAMKAHPAIKGHEVLLLSHGLEIGVLRKEDA